MTDPTIPLPASAWEAITEHLDATGFPWPPGACVIDVRMHERLLAAGVITRRVGSPYFAARWRVTDFEARKRMVQARAVDDQDPPAGEPLIETPPSAGAGAAVDRPSPADQQPRARPGGAKTSTAPADAAAPAPLFPDSPSTRTAAAAPIYSKDLLSEGSDSGIFLRGSGGGAAPAVDRVQGEDTLGDEARVFLAIWRSWGPGGHRRQGLRADHPARQWTGSTPEALSWFLREIVGAPDYRGLDMRAGLTEWSDYLDDKADKWGTPGTTGRGRFPSRWKQALRRWFNFRLEWARDNSSRTGYTSGTSQRGHHGPQPAQPRGTWAGARQPVAAADPRQPSDDDFERWGG